MTASRFLVFAVLGDVNRFLSAPAWLILVCLLMVSPPTEAAIPRNVLVLYWTYTLRGDVGGFGVGSDLTWHMITTFISRTRSGSVGTSATG